MHQSDAHHVRKLLARYEAAEAATIAGGGPVRAPAAAEEPAADTTDSQEAEALLAPEGGSGSELDTSKVAAPAAWEGDAVLPWWLPPERIPAAFSGGQLGGGAGCCMQCWAGRMWNLQSCAVCTFAAPAGHVPHGSNLPATVHL